MTPECTGGPEGTSSEKSHLLLSLCPTHTPRWARDTNSPFCAPPPPPTAAALAVTAVFCRCEFKRSRYLTWVQSDGIRLLTSGSFAERDVFKVGPCCGRVAARRLHAPRLVIHSPGDGHLRSLHPSATASHLLGTRVCKYPFESLLLIPDAF